MQISKSRSGSCSMAFSAFRKTFWLLFGHNDKKRSSKCPPCHRTKLLHLLQKQPGLWWSWLKYIRIYWLLKTTAQFGTLFLLNYIARELDFPAQGSFLPHTHPSYTAPRAPFFSSSHTPTWKSFSPIPSYLSWPTLLQVTLAEYPYKQHNKTEGCNAFS